jgi:hypothetical protein
MFTRPKSAYSGVDVLSREERELLLAASKATADGVFCNPLCQEGFFAARQLAAFDLGVLRACVFKINDRGRAAIAELLRDGKVQEPIAASDAGTGSDAEPLGHESARCVA